MGRRSLIAIAALGLACVLAALYLVLRREESPGPAPGPLVFGISGEQPADLRDPRFRALGLKRARVQVSFDLYSPPAGKSLPGLDAERARLDEWFRAARAADISEVLVAFKAERDRPDLVPDAASYRRGITATLRHLDAAGYGEMVTQVSPWNEPDFSGTVSADQAGSFYRQAEELCRRRGCTLLAGDFSDGHWTPAYQRRYQQAAGNPTRWAWHAYGPDRSRLARFLSMIPAGSQVQFTEQGGIVHRPGAPPQSAQRASRQLSRQLELARQTPQVTSFYVYQWRGERPPRWDSGLVSPSGRMRPAYCLFDQAAQAGSRYCSAGQPLR